MKVTSILRNDFRQFFDFIDEGKLPIGYRPKYREFYLFLSTPPGAQNLIFCPWSGKEFPKSLSDEYFDIIEDESLSEFQRASVKSKMQDESWWIERGL
jgi:hypothetical protein